MSESMVAQIETLRGMPLQALRTRYQEVFGGEEEPSFKRDFLWRRIAHRLQEQAFGGLSETARQSLDQLRDSPHLASGLDPVRRARAARAGPRDYRDRRLPMPGRRGVSGTATTSASRPRSWDTRAARSPRCMPRSWKRRRSPA